MRLAPIVVVCLGVVGCAVPLYDGPRRSSGDVAIIKTDGIILVSVDGDEVPVEALKFEVLPGPHALAIRLHDTTPTATILTQDTATKLTQDELRYSKRALKACFIARPGHGYIARPVYAGPQWSPEIIDENLAETIRSWEPSNDGGCDTPHAATSNAN